MDKVYKADVYYTNQLKQNFYQIVSWEYKDKILVFEHLGQGYTLLNVNQINLVSMFPDHSSDA